jgi:hypothetical protein
VGGVFSSYIWRGICTAAVARIWENSVLIDFRSVAAMTAAGIAYKDGFLLNTVSALSMAGAWIDGVLVVKASADRVAFDDLIAHLQEDESIVKLWKDLSLDWEVWAWTPRMWSNMKTVKQCDL